MIGFGAGLALPIVLAVGAGALAWHYGALADARRTGEERAVAEGRARTIAALERSAAVSQGFAREQEAIARQGAAEVEAARADAAGRLEALRARVAALQAAGDPTCGPVCPDSCYQLSPQ